MITKNKLGSAILKIYLCQTLHITYISNLFAITNFVILWLLAREIKNLQKKVEENKGELSNEVAFDFLQKSQGRLQLETDFLPFIALCALFPPQRNILKNWSKNEKLFIDLVQLEGKVGIDHIMQALVLFFIRKHNTELSKYAGTFMKKLVDENVMTEKYLIDWFDKTIRLDKDSNLYDKKAEKKFRDLIEQFITWLR